MNNNLIYPRQQTAIKYVLMAMLIGMFWANARGQTNSWTDGTGNWENGADWSSGGPPFNGEDVFITNATSKTVTIDTNTTSDSAFSLTIGSLRLAAPSGITNTLKVINADSFPFQMNTLFVGAGGSMLVSNTMLSVAISNTISNGHMTVLNTTTVPSSIGSTNFAFTVTGSSATFSNSGPAAFENVRGASLVVSNGARMDTDDLHIGYNLSNVLMRADLNVFTVTGTNSQLNSHVLSIGEVGSSNQFIVGNGATIRVKSALRLSSTPNTISNLMQVLPGGTLIVGDNVFVANTNGAGATMNIAGGLSTLASNLITASFANSTGAVNVTAGQLVVTNGVIGIGNGGTSTNGTGVGHMMVSNATVLASSILLGSSTGGHGELVLAAGGIISDGGCPFGTNCILVVNSFSNQVGTLIWSNGSAYCGVGRTGDYYMTNGSSAVCQNMYAGYDNVGTMTMAGGVMNITSHLIVGNLGPPFSSSVSTGTVWISGGQLTMNSDYSIIGNSGIGQMSISNGTVTAGNVFVGNSSNSATLTLAGGALTVDSLVLTNLGSRFIFTGGLLNANAITNVNGQVFTVGNGVNSTTLNLMGGITSMAQGLKISTNATLSGFGTITGNMANFGLVSLSSGELTFTGGNVTNNGTMRAVNAVIEAYGTVVNNGTIDVINGGTNFHGAFINHGTVLDAHSIHVSNTMLSGNDVTIQISSVVSHTYQLQIGSSLTSTNWVNSSSPQSGTGGILTFTDFGGATNTPPRFYRLGCSSP
jgi:hypothetical protein